MIRVRADCNGDVRVGNWLYWPVYEVSLTSNGAPHQAELIPVVCCTLFVKYCASEENSKALEPVLIGSPPASTEDVY